MHEFSIAQNIIEIAKESAENAGCKKIINLDIEVGTQSGVVFEAIETALESAKTNSMLEQARINIIKIEAEALCNDCKHQFPVDDLFSPCPKCNSINTELIK